MGNRPRAYDCRNRRKNSDASAHSKFLPFCYEIRHGKNISRIARQGRQREAAMTWARILADTGPFPYRLAMALAASSVISSSRAASRVMISLRSGVPGQKATAAWRGGGAVLVFSTVEIETSEKPALVSSSLITRMS